MSRSSWLWGTLLASALVLGLTAGRSVAQTVVEGAPPENYAAPAVSYYAAPAVSYYAAPAVSYYAAPAPAVSYYAPGATAVTTVRTGLLGRRQIVKTRYYATAPAAVYAPAPVAAPSVAGYYSPVYLYP